jgi:hypothetical protein
MPLRELESDGDQPLPVDGLVVEELHDEATLRRVIRSWRRRVSQEYVRAYVQGHDDRSASVWTA